jgi:hypothetical protein
MPTVLFKNGWRFFFFSNEGNEPMHIHVMKAEKYCKYFIDESNVDLKMAHSKKMNNKDMKEVKEIIYDNFNYIVESWKKFQNQK